MLGQVRAVSDLAPPTLVAASITSGATMNTENTTYQGYNELLVNVQANDDLSGSQAPLIVYTSPSGNQTASGGSNGVDASEWISITSFPQYSEAGVWTPTMYLEDYSGNKVTYTDSQLQVMGINIDVTLTGQGDTTNPELVSITRIGPGELDVTGYIPSTNFTVHMTDNVSGFGIPTLTYTSPSGNQVMAPAVCNIMDGHTSTVADYDCAAYFNQYSETGIWTPDLFIADGAGNIVHLSNNELLARGIDARVSIVGTSDTTPPTLSDVDVTFANPPADNIPFGGAVMTLTGTVTDNLSGINGTSYIGYTSPTGKTVYGSLHIPENNGVFISDVFLPLYAEGGTWLPTIFVQDPAGNQRTYSVSDLEALGSNIAITVSKNITENATPGGTVTSDYENDGATSANPIEASVTTPTGGPVSIVIVQSDDINSPTNSYTFFDRQLNITAPTETVESPLTLSFTIDSSVVPSGESASTLQITRNGTVVSECTDQTTATPNPCVFSRQTLGGGDILVQIHSTTASAWASGFPTHTSDYNFVGFSGGTKDYSKVNKAQAGQVLSIEMKIKDVPHGVTDILAAGEPTSQRVNCSTLATIGSPEATLSPKNSGLERIGKNKFEYDWRTVKSWENTCRVFNVQLIDGSSQKALFKFQ
ncbi:PxKF domain-containing protein [Candidatus Saccharibacteria bacterium]|nr:MAG: PxKF domain-containing protein [Candidatus Saccharibacteria bacterium]